MDPRLKKNRQTLLLQKRTFISDNELYEMMRSRHVYYVQTELSKQLDRTLKALKQDEKMKLVGFRIQKAMFLKRIALLQKRKLEVLNTGTGGDSNNLPSTRVSTEMSSISETAAKRRDFSHSVSVIENNSKTASGQGSNRVEMSMTQSETDETGKAELRTEINQPVSKLKQSQGKMKSTLNSQWMSIIQEKAQKSDVSVATKAGHTPQSPAHSRRKSHGDKMFQSVSESGSSESIAENKSQLLNERVNLHNEPTGRTEVINFNRRRKTEKTNFGLLSGYLDRNYRQSESGSVCATISEIDESCPRIDCDELSISSELRKLTLNEVDKNTNTEEGDVLGRSSVHTVPALNAPVRNNKSIDHKVLAGISSSPLNELDPTMTSSTKPNAPYQEHGDANINLVINPTSKLITPTTTETKNSTSGNTPERSRHTETINTLSKHKTHVPPQVTPYLDRSRSLSFNKESTFLKSKGRQIYSSLSGKLERTITMIYVEDPDDGNDNPPKSQFDVEAWLSYNKRRRGYTKVFDDEVSTVTLEEDTSKEANKPVPIRGSKKRPKRNVRFYLSRKQTLHPDPKPLSFREKSKEWYLNFRQAKRNIKKPKVHQINQKPASSRARVASGWGYTVLPEIGAQSDSYVLSSGGSEGNPDQKLSDGTGSHIILRESTDQRLQRLKDHSKILQIKVHDFVCS